MAAFDSADLLSRVTTMAQRPLVDEDVTPAQWYQWLGEAQVYWMGRITEHAPELNTGAPELMTTSDGGLTYSTANVPMGNVEILASIRGPLLTPGTFWGSGDFVPSGQTISMVGARARTFGGLGPYARYVPVPGLLDATNAPVMKPAHMRLLLVARACILYATRGGFRDPAPFEAAEQRLWSGSPNLAGDVGFVGELKSQYFNSGAAAISEGWGNWYQNADFGVGR